MISYVWYNVCIGGILLRGGGGGGGVVLHWLCCFEGYKRLWCIYFFEFFPSVTSYVFGMPFFFPFLVLPRGVW